MVSHRAVVTVLAGAALSSRSDCRMSCFHTRSGGCWQASDPRWLLARDISSLPREPFYGPVHSMSSGFSQSKGSMRGTPKWKPQPYYDLILEVISRHFFQSLFIRSESLRPAHTQGEELIEEPPPRWWSLLMAILEAAHHTGCCWWFYKYCSK